MLEKFTGNIKSITVMYFSYYFAECPVLSKQPFWNRKSSKLSILLLFLRPVCFIIAVEEVEFVFDENAYAGKKNNAL
jgi:hypothetical protein